MRRSDRRTTRIARRSAKNSLTATDAKLMEDAFERRLSEIPSSDAAASSNDASPGPEIAGSQVIATERRGSAREAAALGRDAGLELRRRGGPGFLST